MSDRHGASALWTTIGETQINEHATADLAGFRAGEVNYRLALYDVATNGGRYLN
jgi:hypothetical protein